MWSQFLQLSARDTDWAGWTGRNAKRRTKVWHRGDTDPRGDQADRDQWGDIFAPTPPTTQQRFGSPSGETVFYFLQFVLKSKDINLICVRHQGVPFQKVMRYLWITQNIFPPQFFSKWFMFPNCIKNLSIRVNFYQSQVSKYLSSQ